MKLVDNFDEESRKHLANYLCLITVLKCNTVEPPDTEFSRTMNLRER